MRRHMWMHVGMLAAILAIFGLSALGVTIPSAVIYLVVLACPLMMVFMMFGMDHDHESADRDASVTHDHQTHPPAGTPR